MARKQHLDDLLKAWRYNPEGISVRVVRGANARDVLQMRVDLGILQLEMDGRPDGERPEGFETYFDYLQNLAFKDGAGFEMTEEQCAEADREFVQYYHRRNCWLAMRDYERARRDADHTLAFMDFCTDHSPDDDWTVSHEQFRPFVLFDRTRAAAFAEQEAGHAELAVEEVNKGLEAMRKVFVQYEAEESFDDDELVSRLIELREYLREKYAVGRTLLEQLADAVAAEKYELAAKLRDMLSGRTARHR